MGLFGRSRERRSLEELEDAPAPVEVEIHDEAPPAPEPPRRMPRWFAIPVLAVAVAGPAMWALSRGGEEAAPRPTAAPEVRRTTNARVVASANGFSLGLERVRQTGRTLVVEIAPPAEVDPAHVESAEIEVVIAGIGVHELGDVLAFNDEGTLRFSVPELPAADKRVLVVRVLRLGLRIPARVRYDVDFDPVWPNPGAMRVASPERTQRIGSWDVTLSSVITDSGGMQVVFNHSARLDLRFERVHIDLAGGQVEPESVEFSEGGVAAIFHPPPERLGPAGIVVLGAVVTIEGPFSWSLP